MAGPGISGVKAAFDITQGEKRLRQGDRALDQADRQLGQTDQRLDLRRKEFEESVKAATGLSYKEVVDTQRQELDSDFANIANFAKTVHEEDPAGQEKLQRFKTALAAKARVLSEQLASQVPDGLQGVAPNFAREYETRLNSIVTGGRAAAAEGAAAGTAGNVELETRLGRAPTATEIKADVNVPLSPQELAAQGDLTVEALTDRGFSPDQARARAFGIDQQDDFVFMSQAELQANGFPGDAIVQQNAKDGSVNVISEGTESGVGALEPEKRLKVEQDMRRDFNKASADFDDSQRSNTVMKQLAKDGTGASDVALVFSFFKVIDPQSTVREGEFATAASTAGLPARIVTQFAKLDSGEILPQTLREELVASAGRFFVQREGEQKAKEQFYIGLADRAGVNAGNVVRSRVKGADKFSTMDVPALKELDLSTLSEAERAQVDKRFKELGF